MSFPLWKYLFDDDIDSFRQYLAKATFDRNAGKNVNSAHNYGASLKVGSPGYLSVSPKTPTKARKGAASTPQSSTKGAIVLTRSAVNARDSFGRTLLHHAVSSKSADAIEFVRLLLEIPTLDLYVQDTESGWTALHRALYFGNVAAAQALTLKDIQNATDYTTNVSHANAGGLVKIKDHEGNSPFEAFGLTTAPRDLQEELPLLDAAETMSVRSVDMDEAVAGKARVVSTALAVELRGDEIFAFGSNKNLTLGLGDGDDRTFPERLQLKRPEFLQKRLFADFKQQRAAASIYGDCNDEFAHFHTLPTVVKSQPIIIQDVVMAKLHTAVLTADPIANLHICGFGPGGRLGTGNEVTAFSFTCVDSGGLGRRKVISVALGQDHTLAVCSSGEVFAWGSNKYGQLGIELPETPVNEVPTQLTPRQIFGLVKKESFIGAAASSIHSAIYTSTGLYTFGKNEGQLGLMDADARSLEMQTLPRRVGVSVFAAPIQNVVAVDRATVVLLETHDVIVFTHYGYTRVSFPLESFGSSIASDSFFARHQRPTKHISRVTAAGNTIAALTSYGEVFTIDVPKHNEPLFSGKSTTNPSKARNALPTPSKIWSIRKAHMAATDAAVGQDGSIILATAAGTVWRKEKRAKIKTVTHSTDSARTKDYKFVRVPNLFGAVAVRSNAFGAFMAVRKDCDVLKEQITPGPSTLSMDLFKLLSFHQHGSIANDITSANPQLRFWQPVTKGACSALIRRAIIMAPDDEETFKQISNRHTPLSEGDYDVWVTSKATDVRFPVHSLMLKARSTVLRRALAQFGETYYFEIPDLLSIEYGNDGQIQLSFGGVDFLTLANFVTYIYTDTLIDVWRFTAQHLSYAPRFRLVRSELMKIASALDLSYCERAVRVMDEPLPCLREDFEHAFHDSDLFSDADVVIDLADEEERYAHSLLLQTRCPFFEGLFHGHTGGMWMADRRQAINDDREALRVDLKHVESTTFEFVLRHIYADTGAELFDTVITRDVDELIDLVIDVMAVANELMLGRLVRVCQEVVGKYVTPWNVCGLLNTIAESSEHHFKQAGLEYIGLNLEYMLEQKLLAELDEYLLLELNEVVQSNQLAFMPIGRSDRPLEEMLERDPTLSEQLDTGRQRRLDSMQLPYRYQGEQFKPVSAKVTISSSKTSPAASPIIQPGRQDDLPFEMDTEDMPQSGQKQDARSPQQLPRQDSAPDIGHFSSSHRNDIDLGSPSLSATPTLASPPIGEALSIGKPAGLPWATARTSSNNLGLRDIMLQDSSSKVSNLTVSLQKAAAASRQTPIKVSQKDRKRQQHELKLQAATYADVRASSNLDLKSAKPASPWQKIPSKSEMDLKPVASQPEAQPVAKPQSTATQMKSNKISPNRKDKQPQVSRSVSSPGMTGDSSAPPPQIQSIRHTPTPNRSSSWLDARTSMADILAQQQYEKISIQDEAAKRSLQEIQQEQEFQAWWDAEARKVQAEEASALRQAKSLSRGRGGKHKGRTRDVAKQSTDGPVTTPVRPDEHGEQNTTTSRGKSKFRGRGRGRGKGAEQPALARQEI